MVEFEKVQVGKKDAHLIGMQHENSFFGEILHRPGTPKKRIIERSTILLC